VKRLDAAHVSFSRNWPSSGGRQMCALSREFGISPRKRSLNEENVRILGEFDYRGTIRWDGRRAARCGHRRLLHRQ
jgi:hypothetical protein